MCEAFNKVTQPKKCYEVFDGFKQTFLFQAPRLFIVIEAPYGYYIYSIAWFMRHLHR